MHLLRWQGGKGMPELPFGFDQPEDSPGFLLWQTTVVWQRLIKKVLEPAKVSHAQFVIMALLLWSKANNVETTQVLIAKRSKLDKMTVSVSLKKLVERGLVSRVEQATDTRAKSVSLTETGAALVHELIPKVERVDALFFKRISKEDQQMFISIVTRLAGA